MKKPTLVINRKIAKRNITNMISLCRKHQMDFRPHFKTHQSAEIGECFKEEGISKCTVSSMGMAQYFADAGWKDICVAIPLNILEIEDAAELAKCVQLSICVDHLDTLRAVKKVEQEMGVFIEIDTGYGRSGVLDENLKLIEWLVSEIAGSSKLSFKGFLSHTGNSYHAQNPQEGVELFEEARKKLLHLKQQFLQEHPQIILSLGDTPSSKHARDFSGIDEWRPGNFIFYDWMQYALKSCEIEDIALKIHCPVIGIYPDRKEVVIYGGGVHLSKEGMEYQAQKIYGWVINKDDKYQGFPVISLSQEHGTIKANSEFIEKTKIGDFLEIIPIHSCMMADLNAAYQTETGAVISKYRTF